MKSLSITIRRLQLPTKTWIIIIHPRQVIRAYRSFYSLLRLILLEQRGEKRELQAEIAASDRRRANKRSIRFPVCDPAAKRIGESRFPPITGAWNDYHEPDEIRGSENDSFERLSRCPRRLSWNVISRYSRHDIPLTRDARL